MQPSEMTNVQIADYILSLQSDKAAQEVWRKEDGDKTAYYEWLLAASTKGEAK